MTDAPATLGIYVHWPFCAAKCPYCDFNSHVREEVDQARWARALLAELDAVAAETPGRTVTSVFFGGGTPSLMPGATVATVIDAIAGHWTVADDIEITAEANPGSTDTDKLADFRAAGINRISLGVQSFDDGSLRFLGRQHNADEARIALQAAVKHFDRYSLDLIYGLPEQTRAGWEAQLAEALRHAGDHISVYQLTIERGTSFYDLHKSGELVPPEGDTLADLYEATQTVLDAAGLPAYEISNHAAPGGPCRHNMTCWQGGDYAGIGPGAHGRLTKMAGGQGPKRNRRFATLRIRSPERWIDMVERQGSGAHEPRELGPSERLAEMLLTGLRTTSGIARSRFVEECGMPIKAALDADALQRFSEAGWIARDAEFFRLTPQGRLRLDGIAAQLLPDSALS